jgi:ubiquinone/menaquinone biosynthesis C-methylase UbiE
VLADAKDTRLPAGMFDVIFSNSILHHISQADRFWAEMKRLAARGAVVLLRDLARPASPQAARDIVDRYAANETALLKEEYYRSLLSAYTVGEVEDQLARAALAGLEVAMASDRHMDVFGRLP